MNVTLDVNALLGRRQAASAAVIEAECRDPYSYEVDDLTDSERSSACPEPSRCTRHRGPCSRET